MALFEVNNVILSEKFQRHTKPRQRFLYDAYAEALLYQIMSAKSTVAFVEFCSRSESGKTAWCYRTNYLESHIEPEPEHLKMLRPTHSFMIIAVSHSKSSYF